MRDQSRSGGETSSELLLQVASYVARQKNGILLEQTSAFGGVWYLVKIGSSAISVNPGRSGISLYESSDRL